MPRLVVRSDQPDPPGRRRLIWHMRQIALVAKMTLNAAGGCSDRTCGTRAPGCVIWICYLCFMPSRLLALFISLALCQLEATAQISIDASSNAGLLYWRKTIDQTITSYNPFTTQTSSLDFHAEYKEPLFAYSFTGKARYAFKKFSLGLYVTHTRLTKRKLTSDPFQYSWLSYYDIEQTYFNHYGITLESIRAYKHIALHPFVDLGIHFYGNVQTTYYKNNFVARGGFKIQSRSSYSRFFLRPEMSLMAYKSSVVSYSDEEQNAIEGAWQRWSEIDRNFIISIGLAVGATVGGRR